MNHLNPRKTGVALGAFAALCKLVWVILIAFGWAQPLVSFALWANMMNMPYTIGAFDFATSLTLIVVAAVTAYVIGYFFAIVWNWAHRG